MKPKSVKLLDALVIRFPDRTREELFSNILCGDVFWNEECLRDPKAKVFDDGHAVITNKRFVSRGGLKLEGALQVWNFPVEGAVFLDAGSSTGGFTDCLLQRGAKLVHAVDVGSNQLDWKLRNDPRVRVWEQVNVMALDSLDPQPHAAVADLSFRSLRGAARKILDLTSTGQLIALTKPQFEWLNPPADFNGIVDDERIPEIIEKLIDDLRLEGVSCNATVRSNVRGRKGNQEVLAWLTLSGSN